MTSDEAVPGC